MKHRIKLVEKKTDDGVEFVIKVTTKGGGIITVYPSVLGYSNNEVMSNWDSIKAYLTNKYLKEE